MTTDDLLIAINIAGIGLSGAYLRAELVSHLRLKAARGTVEHSCSVGRTRAETKRSERSLSVLVQKSG